MRSLKAILSLSLSFIICFVGFTAAIIYYYQSLKKEKFVMDNFVRIESTTIPIEIAQPLWKYDLDGVRLLCRERLKDNRIDSIKIVDDEQNVVFHIDNENSDKSISLVRPILYNGENIGTVDISFSNSELVDLRKNIFKITFFILLFVVIAAISSVITLTTQFVQKPFKYISKILLELKNENYAWQFQGSRLKEIQPILNGLTTLSRELSKRDKQIKEHTHNLERYNETLQNEMERRKNVEAALIESEEKYRILVENQNELVVKFDNQKKMLFVSSNYCKTFGMNEHEIIGSTFLPLIHRDDIKKVKASIDSLSKSPYKTCHEARAKSVEGWRWFGWSLNALVGDNGKIKEIVGVGRDITERKQADQKLQRNEQKLKFILDSLPDMIIEVDSSLKILWANKTALSLNPGAVGQTCYKAFPGNQTVCEGCYCKKVFETGKIESGTMYQPASKTAGESYWENVGVPLKDSNGKVLTVLEVSRNVTARELARQRELKLQKDLIHAQKMESVGTLAGGIAHEFNNILSIIIGNNELIMDDLPEQGLSRESCDEIRLAGLRAKDIVKHLLTFSRQDDSIKKPINIGAVVKESLKLIRATTPKNIEIRENISPDCHLVLGDPTQMNQILINLCNNAAHALPIAGGIINIELLNTTIDSKNELLMKDLAPGEYVSLRVRDNGSGMDKGILDRIFDPYFTTKDVGEGSGIGLAVVHGIVENHGGSIVCESVKGEGTTFTIQIPAHEGFFLAEDSMKQDIPHGEGENILYVDDEPSIAKLGKRHLESLGYNVFSTTDPKEALEMIKANPDRFHLVVSDMAMPNMPGDQLIAQILSINPEIPTMICSGYSSRMSETKASEMGIKAFVIKPLDQAELAKKVREVLDGSNI